MLSLDATVIPSNTYPHSTDITEIVMLDTVQYVGSRAFTHCTSLTNVTISSSVYHLGIECFANCPNLTHVQFNVVKCNALSGCFKNSNIQQLSIPRGIRLSPCVLEDCDKLTTLTLDTNVSYRLACGCTALKHVVLTNNVKSIQCEAFRDASPELEINTEHVELMGSNPFPHGTRISLRNIQCISVDTLTSMDIVDLPNRCIQVFGTWCDYNSEALEEEGIDDHIATYASVCIYIRNL